MRGSYIVFKPSTIQTVRGMVDSNLLVTHDIVHYDYEFIKTVLLPLATRHCALQTTISQEIVQQAINGELDEQTHEIVKIWFRHSGKIGMEEVIEFFRLTNTD